MQKRLWLGVLLVGFPTASMFGSGCSSSSSDDSTAQPDAAQDVTQKADVGPDVVVIVDAGPRCDGADLNNVSLPDASLGDSGATTGTCVACMQASCASQITKCDESCSCKAGVDDALTCVANAGTLDTSCLGGLTGDPNAQNLGLCIYAACKNECGLGGFTLPDGSILDAGDQ